AIGDDWNDNVCFAGMAENLSNAVSGETIVAGKHHDVGRSCSPSPSLVGTAEAQISQVVEDADAGILRRQILHPLPSLIGAYVVDKDDFVFVPIAHRFTHRADRRLDVILLVEAGNNETESWGGHGGFGGPLRRQITMLFSSFRIAA